MTPAPKKIGKKVEIRKINNEFILYRNNKPYFIKGAGGYSHFEDIKSNGGNSVRVWEAGRAGEILDEAHKYGLSVTLGIYVGHERHGFDYKNKNAVKQQLASIKEIVLKYKDHPALLMWGIGNELELLSNDYRVWVALNDIAKMIHKIDSDHPVTTMVSIAGYKLTFVLNLLCPNLDVLSINKFGGLPTVPESIKKSFWNGPYIVSEWGPNGFWESERTSWDMPIEHSSSKKADVLIWAYEASIKKDRKRCLGSYVFYWGNKQERTPTWFGLFLESGEKLNMVNAVHYIWTGKWPKNMAPVVKSMKLDNNEPIDDVFLRSNKTYTAVADAVDPDQDPLRFEWKIFQEITGLQISHGGDKEIQPGELSQLILDGGNTSAITFNAPAEAGPYRLYLYVFDDQGHAATVNFPFYVMH